MKLCFLLLLAFFLGACASSSTGIGFFDDDVEVEHLMFANSFIYPESQGKTFGFNMKLGYAGSDSVKLVEDIDDASLTSNPKLKHGAAPAANYVLGLISHVDVYYSEGPGVKLQLWGSGADDAKKGNFSMALAANQINLNSKTSTSDTTGSVKEAEATIEGDGFHYQVLFGYRNTDTTLIYGGAFFTETTIDKVEVFQTNNTDFTFRGDIAKGEGNIKGLNLGIYQQKRKSWFETLSTGYGLEAAYSIAEWTDSFTSPNEDIENEGFHIGGVVSIGW